MYKYIMQARAVIVVLFIEEMNQKTEVSSGTKSQLMFIEEGYSR